MYESAGGQIAEEGSSKPTRELTDRGIMSDEEDGCNGVRLLLNPLEKGAAKCTIKGGFYFYVGGRKIEFFQGLLGSLGWTAENLIWGTNRVLNIVSDLASMILSAGE